jgi:hypothetical protein
MDPSQVQSWNSLGKLSKESTATKTRTGTRLSIPKAIPHACAPLQGTLTRGKPASPPRSESTAGGAVMAFAASKKLL